jgi:hypothetical protein
MSKSKKKLWFYDCDMGQGSVIASSYETARKIAITEAGTYAQVRNVHPATKEEIEFRKIMGGSLT